MKKRHVDMYMEIAHTVAKSSYAKRLKVGAIAVKNNRILSVGYNGTPPGTPNACEDIKGYGENNEPILVTKPTVIHAEQNLIYKMARDGESAEGATLFLTHSPCMTCALAILSSGFDTVYFKNQYRSDEGVEFLKDSHIKVIQYDI